MDLKAIRLSEIHYTIPALEPAAPQRRPILEFARQLMRAGLFSVLIFTVGFLGINAQSYVQILKASVLEATGNTVESPLEQFVELPSTEPAPQKLLVVQRTPDAQKSQIPELNLEVTPPDNRLIIPKINKNIPLIDSDPQKLMNANWQSLEKTFQEDLQNGVIHYPGTADPGETGNVFITGHSSYYPWDPGRYKSVFARLKDVQVGDDLIVYHNQKKYHYVVREKKEVRNDDVSVLNQGDKKMLTLMTCSPVGTNFKRLVVIAEEVQM